MRKGKKTFFSSPGREYNSNRTRFTKQNNEGLRGTGSGTEGTSSIRCCPSR